MALLLRCIFCALLLCFPPAFAATKQEVLFDVIVDMDHEGALDRAVLLGQGRTDAGSASKDFYQLYPGERADLLIYLNHGDGVLDLNKLPTFRKDNIISGDELAFVMPLAVNARGSLNVVSSNGFGNTFNTTETLTIVYRDGAFLVAGWAQDFYNSRQDESSHCSVNYLAGKAVKRVNTGKGVRLKGVFKPVPLTEWTVAILPTLCEE